MHLFYKLDRSHMVPNPLKDENEVLAFNVTKPKYGKYRHVFIWDVLRRLNGGKYYELTLTKDGKVVCSAEIISPIIQFPFLPKGSMYFGAARTPEDRRGRGYYPYLLTQMAEIFPEYDFYLLIDQNNISSQRGVEKAGYKCIGVGYRNLFGQYILSEKV